MKKIVKLCIVGFFMFGFLFSSLGQNPAHAAGWLTPEWYAKYYSSKNTNPQPEPTPAPTPEPNPRRSLLSAKPTTNGNLANPLIIITNIITMQIN